MSIGKDRCTFVSVWDDRIELHSKAVYDSKHESVEVLEIHEVDGLDILVEEYIEFPDKSTLDVCTQCHEGILKTTMEPNEINPMDKHLYEVTRCTVCGD